MGLALQGSPPLFPVADFFLVSQLFISLGGRTGVESAQWVSVRDSPGTWHLVGTQQPMRLCRLLWSVSQDRVLWGLF